MKKAPAQAGALACKSKKGVVDLRKLTNTMKTRVTLEGREFVLEIEAERPSSRSEWELQRSNLKERRPAYAGLLLFHFFGFGSQKNQWLSSGNTVRVSPRSIGMAISTTPEMV